MPSHTLKLNKQDEYYTPKCAIYPIIKFLKPGSTILCPFDTEDSNFVKVLREQGFNVLHIHISEGKDFFKLRKIRTKVDYIISNPPYSKKTEVFEKLFELNIPFAMLINTLGLFDNNKRFSYFEDKNIGLLYLYPRVPYFFYEDGVRKQGGGVFQSAYLCYNILPKDLILERIKVKD